MRQNWFRWPKGWTFFYVKKSSDCARALSPRGGNRLEKGAVLIYSQNDASFNPFMASIAGRADRCGGVCASVRSASSLTVHKDSILLPRNQGVKGPQKGLLSTVYSKVRRMTQSGPKICRPLKMLSHYSTDTILSLITSGKGKVNK